MSESNGMNRRGFLKNSAMGIGALGAGYVTGFAAPETTKTGSPETPAVKEPKVKEFRPLGRTGFKASDISSGYVKDPAVLEQLLDAGVNYIDTAEVYGNEGVVGDVVSKRDRKKIFITSKLVIKKNPTKKDFLDRTHKCLERLKSDYVDCMMIHSCESIEMMNSEPFHQAMAELKKQGKVRHVGISNHGGNFGDEVKISMEKLLTAAAEDGRFDVMLLVYNFIQTGDGSRLLDLCRKKNIGTTLMKVNPIGGLPRLRERIKKQKAEGKEINARTQRSLAALEARAKQSEAYIKKHKLDNTAKLRDAAIRFCLDNKDVHSVCCGFRTFDDVENYLALSGSRLSGEDKTKLAAYREGCGSFYCRHACGQCESSCPQNVPVNSIMRFNHYYEAQGKEKFAMKKYALLPTNKADQCASCAGHCESACPYGVPVQGLLNIAHNTLSLV